MLNITDSVGHLLLTLLLVMSSHVMFSNGSGSVSAVLTPENAIISDGQDVTLQCTVSNVDPQEYKIEWSDSLQNSRQTLQSNKTTNRDTSSRTLSSSLILSTPGPNFILGLYVCEVHSLGRGGNLVTFARSLVSLRTIEKKSKCTSNSRGQEDIIHLFQEGPPVTMSCRIARRPIVELRWKEFHTPDNIIDDLIDFVRDDNGIHRYINSTLRWDPRLNGLIVYCMATRYSGSSAPAEPCIIGLVKIVQPPRIIPNTTSISFGLVNQAEFWCDVRELSRQSCFYTWFCEPMFPGCLGNSNTLFLGINKTTPIPSNREVKVTCHVQCNLGVDNPGVTEEAHATLTFQNKYSISTPNNQQWVAGMINHTEFKVALELYSESDDENILKCAVNMTGYQPTFSWYIDGEPVLFNTSYPEEMHSYYRLGHSFNVVVCEVLIDTTITRALSTFAQLLADALYTSTSTGGITTHGQNTNSNNYTDKYSVLQPSTSTVTRESGLYSLPVSSRQLIIIITICASMAVVVFLWMTVSTFTRNISKWKPRESPKTKNLKIKSKCPVDDTDIYLTPITGEQKGVVMDLSGDYAYPAFERRNPSDVKNGREVVSTGLGSSDQSFPNETHYEVIPGGDLCPRWHRCQTDSADQVYVNRNSLTPPSTSQSSSSLSSFPSSSPPLFHEYHTGHGFLPQDDPSFSKRSHQIHHEYLQ